MAAASHTIILSGKKKVHKMRSESLPNGGRIPRKQNTHAVLGVLVSAGLQKQPHAVRVTFLSCAIQRRASALFGRIDDFSKPVRQTLSNCESDKNITFYRTYVISSARVGTSFQEHTHAVSVAILCGANQRCAIFLYILQFRRQRIAEQSTAFDKNRKREHHCCF